MIIFVTYYVTSIHHTTLHTNVVLLNSLNNHERNDRLVYSDAESGSLQRDKTLDIDEGCKWGEHVQQK